MKKNLVTLMVSGAIIMSLLTGCGASTGGEASQTQEEVVSESTDGSSETEEDKRAEEAKKAEEEAAAKEEEANACYDAGRASLYGLEGTEINLETAYNEFTKAVELGNTDANFYLGLLCDWYSYPKLDYELAKTYYEASGKNPYAKIGLGFLYYSGQGVEENKEKASELFQQVIDQGYDEGYIGSAQIAYDEGDYATVLEKATQVLNGEEPIYRAYASWDLGALYENGYGVEQNYATAIEYYEKSANQGFSEAYNELGVLYYLGEGVEQDYTKAKEMWEKGMELRHTTAIFNLTTLYKNGYGVEQDYNKVIELYQMGIELGDYNAANEIGWLYQNGEGVEQDYTKALEYYQIAADGGNSYGLNNVGWCYENGFGVEQDYEKALEYYDMAANAGNDSGSDAGKENAERLRNEIQ